MWGRTKRVEYKLSSAGPVQRVVLAGVVLLTTARAAAHEPAKAFDLVWPDAEAVEPSVLVTNRGLIFADGEGLALRCSEAYDASTSTRPSAFIEGQTLLLGLYSGAYQTTDRGCSINPGSGLPDVSLGAIVAASDALLAPTRSLDEPAGVWASEDFGVTWSERYTNMMGEYFDRLVAAPSNPDRVYAAGVRQTSTMLASTCGVSDDAARTWTVHPVDNGVKPFAVHPGDPDTVFAVQPVDALSTSYRILRSTDACETFSPVLENVGEPTGLTGPGDSSTLWLGLAAGHDAGGLYLSEDDGATFTETLTEELNFVTCVVQRGERLWVCANSPPNQNGIWFSDDGESLQPFMTMADVPRPVTCEQAEARAECAQPWYDFYSELHPDDAGGAVDAGTTDAAAGVDAGTSPEAGPATDSGAGEPAPDAGAVPGNGPPDAAPVFDGGGAPKAEKGGGCQLSQGGGARPETAPFWLLALLSGWGLRRRLRRAARVRARA